MGIVESLLVAVSFSMDFFTAVLILLEHLGVLV